MCRLLLAAIMVCKICVAFIVFSAIPGVAATGGVPLPDLCSGRRGDRTVSRECAGSDGRVVRFFFNSKRRICKRFGLCQNIATHLDEEADPTINYFQNVAECEQACTDVVECPRGPLQIANGDTGVETKEGEWAQLDADTRLGFGTTVIFKCDRGYGLPEGVWNRTCGLNGTWSGATPTCNIQCHNPEPTGYAVSPPRNYYNIGDQIRVDCMDGHEGSTYLTCLRSGNWEGDYPECSRSCAAPPVDNADPPVIKIEGSTVKFTYSCRAGYTLLNDSSENSTLSTTNYTMSCVNGAFEGQVPVCTRVEIITQSRVTTLSSVNGVYYYQMEAQSRDKVLTCGLKGVDHEQHQARWILPRKPNGELPPEVEKAGNRLTFLTAYEEQNDTYICNICNMNASVIVRVTPQTGGPPNVTLFDPVGRIYKTAGQDATLRTIIDGAQTIQIVWLHNNSNINTTNNDHYRLTELETRRGIFSTLKILGFGEADQGTYQIMARNSHGTIETPPVTLSLGSNRESRDKRSTPFCEKEQTGKVVLSGVVRRLGITEDGLETVTLRVNRILRGEGNGIASSDRVDVRIFSGDDTKWLHRGKHVILSGVPVHSSQQRIIYMYDSPILDYSVDTERAISDC